MPQEPTLRYSNHMQPHTLPRMLTTAEAARCIGITKSTAYDWIARGYIPCHRFGRTIRISSADLEAYLSRSRTNNRAVERALTT
jgi:excisionase family DNA binding protein